MKVLLLSVGICLLASLSLLTVILAMRNARLARNANAEAEHLKNFADAAMEGLAILEGSRIVDANRTFWTMLGHNPDDPPDDFPAGATFSPQWNYYTAADLKAGFVETSLLGADGVRRDAEIAVRQSIICSRPRLIVLMRDISKRKQAAATVLHFASHDALTGIPNAIAWNDILVSALAKTSTERRPAVMLCLDVDGFQAINDLHGHLVGDSVLVECTQRIEGCLTENETLARLGSDEFAILQLKEEQPEDAGNLAERILARLKPSFLVEGRTINLSACIGIALYPTQAQTAEDLQSKAEMALLEAKSEGRGSVRYFEESMERQRRERHRLQGDLHKALAGKELAVHYQPLACLETGGIVGFEVLVRWNHPDLGEVPPSVFAPMAEESGLIVPIGEWVLREACREAQRWAQPLRVAVNLSAVQFGDGNLVATVRSVLAESGLDPARLELEITEGILIRDTDNALTILRELQALGISIAMDDFGTGYSSLSYFRLFPFDKVKIDQSFVCDMADNRQSMAIVKAVIGIGKALGMLVIAEGVETPDQIEILAAEGCQQIQGYLIGRPGPIETFEHLIASRSPESHRCERACDRCLERLRPPSGVRLAGSKAIRISADRPSKAA